MSSSKGNDSRKRPQKHQNRTAFKNNLHDTSTKTKFLNTLDVSGVCKRCKDVIDWKIKYKKYKMLTVPTKCVNCQLKTVKHAYHVMCRSCAKEKNVCAKCCKKTEVIPEPHSESNNGNIAELLKILPERKRRTVIRYLNKNQDGDQNVTPDMMTYIEDIINKTDEINLNTEGSALDGSDGELTDVDD